MRRTVFPPNCEVRNSNPSRLLEFVAKQRRVFAEYGFWLSVPLRTPEEKRAALEARRQEVHAKYGFWLGKTPRTPEEVAGRERYRKEREASYRAAHQEQQKAYRLERNKRLKGAESLGAAKCARPAFVIAAVRALALYLDPDNAEMFVEKRDEGCGMGDETRVSDALPN